MDFRPKINEALFERIFEAVSTHTGGEATRIVYSGFPHVEGETMLDKKNYLIEHFDDFRKTLMLEPRGHENMFGALLTEPVHKEADAGVIFMDTGGYLNMCGHGTIGTVTALIETGMVEAKEPVTHVTLDAPAGLIRTEAKVTGGRVESVALTNVPAFLYKRELVTNIDGREIEYDISFGGSFFALVDADKLGIEICRENIGAITDIGMKMLSSVNREQEIKHPELDITTVDLVEFYSKKASEGATIRNVVIFGDAMADRSPCGTGCSAKVAQLFGKGKLKEGEKIVSESFIGSRFTAEIVGKAKVGDFDAVIPRVTGSAEIMSFGKYVVAKGDRLAEGFSVK